MFTRERLFIVRYDDVFLKMLKMIYRVLVPASLSFFLSHSDSKETKTALMFNAAWCLCEQSKHQMTRSEFSYQLSPLVVLLREEFITYLDVIFVFASDYLHINSNGFMYFFSPKADYYSTPGEKSLNCLQNMNKVSDEDDLKENSFDYPLLLWGLIMFNSSW